MAFHIERFRLITLICALNLVSTILPSTQWVVRQAESRRSVARYNVAQAQATAPLSALSATLGHERSQSHPPRTLARRSENHDDNADQQQHQAQSRRPAQRPGKPDAATPPQQQQQQQQPRADSYRQLTNEAGALLRAQHAASAAPADTVRDAGPSDSQSRQSAILSQHNTLRKAMQAFGDRPRHLGAFRRLMTISNAYEALLAEARRHTAYGRPVPAALQLRLDEARWALAARGKFARAIARTLGALPPAADAATQRRLELDLERVMAELEHSPPALAPGWMEEGRGAGAGAAAQASRTAAVAAAEAGRSLREIGEQMLAAQKKKKARQAPAEPAAPWPALSPQAVDATAAAERGRELRLVPWERAADALAAEAAALERETGQTWLLQGESQEAVSVAQLYNHDRLLGDSLSFENTYTFDLGLLNNRSLLWLTFMLIESGAPKVVQKLEGLAAATKTIFALGATPD